MMQEQTAINSVFVNILGKFKIVVSVNSFVIIVQSKALREERGHIGALLSTEARENHPQNRKDPDTRQIAKITWTILLLIKRFLFAE